MRQYLFPYLARISNIQQAEARKAHELVTIGPNATGLSRSIQQYLNTQTPKPKFSFVAEFTESTVL